MAVLWTGTIERRKRRAHRRAAKAWALAVALAASAGCSYMSDVKASDPGLSADALRSGKLAIVSVVQVNEVPEVRPPLIASLERVLAATRPDLQVVPEARVRPALDDSTERFLLLGYQMHGKADPAWLARAARAIRPMARYALLARIETVKTRTSDRPDPYGDTRTGEIQVTGRDVRVQASVYDVGTLALVFEGEYWGSKEDARSPGDLPPPEPADSLNVESVNDTTMYGVYRKPSPVASAAEPAFLEFARSLPGSESARAGGASR